jgi:hypothetical protein
MAPTDLRPASAAPSSADDDGTGNLFGHLFH